MTIISVLTSLTSLAVIALTAQSTDSQRFLPLDHPLLATPLSAHAADAVAPLPDDVTKETCQACHEDQVASFDRSEHNHAMTGSGLQCSSCHGDATAHVEAGGGAETMTNPETELTSQQKNQTCLNCHERSGEQAHSRLSEHVRAGVACIDCHNAHPSETMALTAHRSGRSSMIPSTETCQGCHSQVAVEFAMPSRHRLHDGAMDCTSCHNVHGSTQMRQLRAEGKDLCLECHQDKRGPFMFEHEAGSLDGCVACHAPHGAPGQHMLKERDTRSMCLSCHSRDMGKGVPHGRASTTTMGDCTRCHTAVHGSNVDPYLLH